MSKDIERKPHGIQLLVRAVVKDPDGKILSDTGQKPSKSFVRNFLRTVYGIFEGVSHGSYVDNRGVDDQMHMEVGVGDDGQGIVVGTGTTPPTNTDSVLESQLTHGTGAGQITHAAGVISAPAIESGNVDMDVTRPFTNNTGTLIIVSEIGIYIARSDVVSKLLHIRDVPASSINVPDKCSLSVYYTWRTTV